MQKENEKDTFKKREIDNRWSCIRTFIEGKSELGTIKDEQRVPESRDR